jgi:hypothetical protein
MAIHALVNGPLRPAGWFRNRALAGSPPSRAARRHRLGRGSLRRRLLVPDHPARTHTLTHQPAGTCPTSRAISGLTVRCFRNDRPPDGRCPTHVARLVSMAMPVSAAIWPGRMSGRLPHTGHQAWTWMIPAAATADMATRAMDTCLGRLHRRSQPASSHDSVVGVRSAWPRPSPLDRSGRPQTLPDTSAAALRHAVQVPDAADRLPASGARPASAVARGTGRRVGGRCWDAASAAGHEPAGRSGGRGAGRGHRSSAAG